MKFLILFLFPLTSMCYWPSYNQLYEQSDYLNEFEKVRQGTNATTTVMGSPKFFLSNTQVKTAKGLFQYSARYTSITQLNDTQKVLNGGIGYGTSKSRDVGQLWIGPLLQWGKIGQWGYYAHMKAQRYQPGFIGETNISYTRFSRLKERFEISFMPGYFFDNALKYKFLLGMNIIMIAGKELVDMYGDFSRPVFFDSPMVEAGDFTLKNVHKISVGKFFINMGLAVPIIYTKTSEKVTMKTKEKDFYFFKFGGGRDTTQSYKRVFFNYPYTWTSLEVQF